MNYFVGMKVLEAKEYAANKESCLIFSESPILCDVIAKIATIEIVEDQV